MAMNHTSRMVGSTSKKNTSDAIKEATPVIESELDKKAAQAESEAVASTPEATTTDSKEPDLKEIKALADSLDMDNFFFTGDIDHTFKMGGKVSITLKVLSSQELQEAQTFLWKLKDEDMSALEAETKYAVQVLSYSLVKYGKKSFEKSSPEERKEFINQLPSMLIPLVFNKYMLLEKAATMAIKEGASLKN